MYKRQAVPCLKALVENGHEIPAVFTQPDRPKGRGYKMIPPPVKKCAEEYSIPVFHDRFPQALSDTVLQNPEFP